jgi:xylulokinase
MNKVILELYDTDGAQGAARGAGIGAGVFTSTSEAFEGLSLLESVEPNPNLFAQYEDVYQNWLQALEKIKN